MIEVKNLSKKYGRKKVLKDVSFTVKRGEFTCLIGVNGVGKTTLLKAMMNLTAVNTGEVLLDGKKITKKSYEKITFIPDSMTIPLNKTIKQAFVFMNDFYKSWDDARAEELLDFFKLDAEERISELSKGKSAKLNLLLGLALEVDYVLMDEPLSGIDIFSKEQITDLFSSKFLMDKAIIVTTHEISAIEHLIDKVVLLDDGKVCRDFSAEEMREEHGKSVVDVMREVYE